MVYLYAVMGVVMMTGIMAIFEMGLSLTGQSLLDNQTDDGYSQAMKSSDQDIYEHISDKGAPSVKFSSIVSSSSDLCSALNSFKAVNWLEIKKEDKDHFFYGSCYSQQGSHRSIVREHKVGSVVSYQLFSCVVDDDKKCPFEKE